MDSYVPKFPTWHVILAVVFSYLVTAHGQLPSTFGSAHRFDPVPGLVVGAHCTWDVERNTVHNRIPSTITEILCRSPNSDCGGNSNYECRQIKTKMVVAYTGTLEVGGPLTVLKSRNTTVSIGCSCVMKQSNRVEQFLHPIEEKRSYYRK